GGTDAAMRHSDLQGDVVDDALRVGHCLPDVGVGAAQVAEIRAAAVERHVERDAGPLLPATDHVLAFDPTETTQHAEAGQELAPGGHPTELRDRHAVPGDADLRPLRGRL